MAAMRPRRQRIYLDACCYNRPFDNPAVSRNHLEGEAIVAILSHIQQGVLALVASEIVEREIGAAGDKDRRNAMLGMLAAAHEMVKVGWAE